MDRYVLLIVDMLNEYLSPQGKIYCKEAINILPNIKKLKACIKQSGGKVIYVNTSHIGTGDPEIKKWGLHAMRGTWGAEVYKEIAPDSDDIIVNKRTYDGFYNTELEITIRSLGFNNVIVTGIHTHVCVMQTALGALYRGFNVTVLEDCMTTGYKLNHDTRLRFFQTHVGELTTLDDFIERLERHESKTNKDSTCET